MPCVTAADTVLEVEGLCVDFAVRRRRVRVLSDISFSVARGETLGIIGESGCGKSMTALALLRMIPSPPGRIAAGRVLLNGEDLIRVPEIPGSVPDLLRGLAGCPFAPRCPSAMSKCRELPDDTRLGDHRSVKCWLAWDDRGDHARS